VSVDRSKRLEAHAVAVAVAVAEAYQPK